MTTIAAIAERIRREDPVAVQIAEECKKGILENSEPHYPPADSFDCRVNMTLPHIRVIVGASIARSAAILRELLPDIEIYLFDFSTDSGMTGNETILNISITFRPREGSKP